MQESGEQNRSKTDKRNKSVKNLFFLSWGCSNLADGMLGAFLPLLLYSQSATPKDITQLSMSKDLCWPLLGLFIGLIVERSRQDKLLQNCNLLRGIILCFCSLSLYFLPSSLFFTFLFLMAFCMGTLEMINDTNGNCMIVNLVEDRELEKTNGQMQSIERLTNMVFGALIGVFFYKQFGIWYTLVILSTLYLIAGSLAFIIGRQTRLDSSKYNAGTSKNQLSMRLIISKIKSSINFIWKDPLLRLFMLVGALVNCLFYALLSLLVFYVKEQLSLGEEFIGPMLTALGMGMVCGGPAAPILLQYFSRATLFYSSTIAIPICFVLFATASTSFQALLSFFLFGIFFTLINVITKSYRQRRSGKFLPWVIAGNRFISWGMQPFGALIAGILVGRLSVMQTIQIIALISLPLGTIVLFNKKLQLNISLKDITCGQ